MIGGHGYWSLVALVNDDGWPWLLVIGSRSYR